MPSIAALLENQPVLEEVTISSEGLVLWLAWNGEMGGNVAQTLQDYGGLCVTAEAGQALWFFFSSDALLALAKLVVWGKFNPLAMTVLAMPGTLRVGVGQALAISLDKGLARQEVDEPGSGVLVWVHPRLRETGANLPGLSYTPGEAHQGMARLKWTLLGADARLPYTSSQRWYALLRPLGNPLDKSFQAGWRALFIRLEGILQSEKLKYSLYDNCLMLPLENLGQLRTWVRELLFTLDDIKERDFSMYWPCVSAVVDRRGLNFNNELPQKVNIDWDELMPDYPYMSYRNAYLLGDGFTIQDRNFSSVSTSIDNWCTVNLTDLDARSGGVPVLMAGQLVSGETPCFYCGVRTHEAGQCPSRRLPSLPPDFWQTFFDLDIDVINAAYRNIELRLAKAGLAGYQHLLEKEGPEARVLQALFALENPLQLRSVERIWMLGGKDIEAEPEESGDQNLRDDSPAWAMVERLQRAGPNDLGVLEKELVSLIGRTPRDWHLHSLMGFVALERGDPLKACNFWHEAEGLCSSVLHQAWHVFLEARILELRGKYTEAMDMYETVHRLLPQWRDAEYRRLVCRVRMGFAEQVQGRFVELVVADPSFFNRLLFDPDLERGRKTILKALRPLWVDALKLAVTERGELERLQKELDAWFPPEHEAAHAYAESLAALQEESHVKNYLSFLNVVGMRPAIEAEIDTLVQREIEILQERFKKYLAALEVVRDEASWFPFQRALVEFNRDFNQGAGILNWAFTADFHTPEAFKKAQAHLQPLDELLERLEKRLRLLRMVRDATLFVLILIRTFLWVEIVCLVVCFVGVMAVLFYGEAMGMLWLQRLLKVNFWELQKVLVSIISITALGVASLRTTLTFEKRRDKMLDEARAQREELQRLRLNRARAKREAQLKAARDEAEGVLFPPSAE